MCVRACVRTCVCVWLDFRKAGFHAHFRPSNDRRIHWLTIQASIDAPELPWLLLLWFVSVACKMSTSAQVAFKWLHIPIDKQTADCNSPRDWLISLASNRFSCFVWYLEHQWMPFRWFWWRHSLCLPLCGYPPASTLLSHIGVLLVLMAMPVKELSKMVGNSTNYLPNSWWIDRL